MASREISSWYRHGHRQPLCGATKPLVCGNSALIRRLMSSCTACVYRCAHVHVCEGMCVLLPLFFPFKVSSLAFYSPRLFDSVLRRRFQTRIHMGPVSCDWIHFKVLVKSNKKPKIRADMLAFIQILILERLPLDRWATLSFPFFFLLVFFLSNCFPNLGLLP